MLSRALSIAGNNCRMAPWPAAVVHIFHFHFSTSWVVSRTRFHAPQTSDSLVRRFSRVQARCNIGTWRWHVLGPRFVATEGALCCRRLLRRTPTHPLRGRRGPLRWDVVGSILPTAVGGSRRRERGVRCCQSDPGCKMDPRHGTEHGSIVLCASPGSHAWHPRGKCPIALAPCAPVSLCPLGSIPCEALSPPPGRHPWSACHPPSRTPCSTSHPAFGTHDRPDSVTH